MKKYKKHSAEANQEKSKRMKGRQFSEEHRRKIGLKHKGMKHSEHDKFIDYRKSL